MIEVDIRRQLGAFGLRAAFSASAPALVALFGASGSGKTSVVNAVAGLLRPDAGRIALDGEVLFDAATGVDVPAERRRLGYVFQDSRLFPHLDVRRNLGYGLRRSQGAARIGFDDVVALLGLESLLARRPGGLSGGERQRVALARALVTEPRCVLADEPTGNLDSATAGAVYALMDALSRELGIAFVIVTHDRDLAARADRVLLLRDGRIVADDRNR